MMIVGDKTPNFYNEAERAEQSSALHSVPASINDKWTNDCGGNQMQCKISTTSTPTPPHYTIL